MDWTSVLISVLEMAAGTLVGVLAGWKIAAHYAREGSQEIRQEAEKLRRLSILILRALREADLECVMNLG